MLRCPGHESLTLGLNPLSRTAGEGERQVAGLAVSQYEEPLSGRPRAGHAVAMALALESTPAGREGRVSLLVLKFGGTSVADIDRIRNVAPHVKREVDAGHACAVVVSAMAGQTNQLVSWVEEAWGFNQGNGAQTSAVYDAREYDAVVASGEQVTSGLLAIVLQSIGLRARSWQGWQIPLSTDGAHRAARITGLAVDTLKTRMVQGED